MKRVYFVKGYCTCLDCDFKCEEQKEMVKHCKKNRHLGEITLTKSIDFRGCGEEIPLATSPFSVVCGEEDFLCDKCRRFKK